MRASSIHLKQLEQQLSSNESFQTEQHPKLFPGRLKFSFFDFVFYHCVISISRSMCCHASKQFTGFEGPRSPSSTALLVASHHRSTWPSSAVSRYNFFHYIRMYSCYYAIKSSLSIIKEEGRLTVQILKFEGLITWTFSSAGLSDHMMFPRTSSFAGST